jgi:micrococcal nuclease
MTKIKIFSFILLVCLLSCNFTNQQTENADDYFIVTNVTDGDTFRARKGNKKEIKVRLIGIDAPESRASERKEVGYYGKEAKDYLTRLLLNQSVRLEYDLDPKDQYGRTLAYVYLKDGTFVNAELMKNGYAMILTIPPNVKYADLFYKLQQEARKKKIGLWNDKLSDEFRRNKGKM